MNPMATVWLALLIAFLVGEGATAAITTIWFAAGALAALLCSMAGGNVPLQIILFFVISALSIVAFRPIAQKYFNNKIEPTNADSIIGRQVLVREKISNLQSTGTVHVGGLTWSARSADDSEIASGTTVRILRIEGVKVYVERVKEDV